MKLTNKLTAMIVSLTLVLPVLLSGCSGSYDPLYYEYDYDLSKYITLGEYKGLHLMGNDVEITDEELDMQIQTMLAEKGDVQNIENRALEAGDTVIYRCHVTSDGEEIAELYEESGTFVLGLDTYGEEADDVLIGAMPGDTVYAKRTLNEFYGELAGKTVEYEFYVLGGYYTVMPNYTNEFVKAYYGYDTIEEFEDAIYQLMYTDRQENMMAYLVGQAWATVVENTTVIAYPEKELDETVEYYVEVAKMNATGAGLPYETYLSAVYGQTAEEFESSLIEDAKADMKEDMIIYAIARAEKLSVSNQKYQEYLGRFIAQYDDFMYEYEVENTFGKELLMSQVLKEVVKEYLVEAAEISISEETDA